MLGTKGLTAATKEKSVFDKYIGFLLNGKGTVGASVPGPPNRRNTIAA
jgi:hypothetical protein